MDPPGIDGGWESVAMEMLTGKPSLCTWDVDTEKASFGTGRSSSGNAKTTRCLKKHGIYIPLYGNIWHAILLPLLPCVAMFCHFCHVLPLFAM